MGSRYVVTSDDRTRMEELLESESIVVPIGASFTVVDSKYNTYEENRGIDSTERNQLVLLLEISGTMPIGTEIVITPNISQFGEISAFTHTTTQSYTDQDAVIEIEHDNLTYSDFIKVQYKLKQGGSEYTINRMTGILKKKSDTAIIEELQEANTEAGEPMGFPNLTDSVISWTDGTKTFSIAPAVNSFDVWVQGKKFTKYAAETLIGDGTDFTIAEGLWYFSYDVNGDLVASQTIWDFSQVAPVYLIYWDNTGETAIIECEERHGITMSWATHKHMHYGEGTHYISGLLPGDITSDGSGDLDAHAQLSIGSGEIADEDIFTSIAAMSLPAQIPVYYKTGASGLWRKTTATNFPVKEYGVSDRLAYNQYTGGTWQQTEVTNNGFVLAHIFALPDVNNDVIAIQGEAEYLTQSAARDGAEIELLALQVAGLPSEEWIPICTLIYQTSDSYSNTVEARIRSTGTGDDFIDWRFYGIGPALGGGPPSPQPVIETVVMPVSIGWVEDGSTPPETSFLYEGATNGSIRLRKFAGDSDNDILFPWKVPHDIKADEGIFVSLDGVITESTVPASDEGVSFKIKGYSIGQGDSIDLTYGSEVESALDLYAAGATTQGDHFLTDKSDKITITDLAANEIAMIAIRRHTGDTDDDYQEFVGIAFINIEYVREVKTS